MTRQTARLCRSCGHGWFAKQTGWTPRPGPLIFSAAQNVGLSYKRAEYDRWRLCPACGSDSVVTAVRGVATPPPSVSDGQASTLSALFAAQSSTAASAASTIDKMNDLGRLLDEGRITPEEFNLLKAQLMTNQRGAGQSSATSTGVPPTQGDDQRAQEKRQKANAKRQASAQGAASRKAARVRQRSDINQQVDRKRAAKTAAQRRARDQKTARVAQQTQARHAARHPVRTRAEHGALNGSARGHEVESGGGLKDDKRLQPRGPRGPNAERRRSGRSSTHTDSHRLAECCGEREWCCGLVYPDSCFRSSFRPYTPCGTASDSAERSSKLVSHEARTRFAWGWSPGHWESLGRLHSPDRSSRRRAAMVGLLGP